MPHSNLPEPAQNPPADDQDSGDEFEISALPTHAAPSHAHGSKSAQQKPSGRRYVLSARGWRGLVAITTLLVAFAIIFNMAYHANQPPGESTTTGSFSIQLGGGGFNSIPTETIYQQTGAPSPTAPSSPVALNPPPATCPSPLATPAAQPPLSGTIGADAVWVGSFTGAHATMNITQKPFAGLTRYGWPVLITVLVRSDFDHPVTISGADLSTGHTLWWSFPPTDEAPGITPSTSNTFTPQHPAPGAPVFWFTSYGTLFLPGAGCYSLQARWPHGGWKFVFAAGS